MPKVIITAQVEDAEKWEAAFRTHGDIFQTYTLQAPIQYSTAGNEVTLCMEPDNLDTFMSAMHAEATATAMAVDGVKLETVKVSVLNREMKL